MKKSVYDFSDVLVPMELDERFSNYIAKFGEFFFDKYLINENDITKLSKYRITISNIRDRLECAANISYQADISFKLMEEEVLNPSIREQKYTSELIDGFSSVAVLDQEYFIQIFLFADSLQAHLMTAPAI